jgi:5-methylcytosine-specific restriction endonuclease McrA
VKRSSLKRTSSLTRRSTLDRGSELKRTPAKRRKKIPVTKREQVYARSGGRCVVCRTARCAQLHHVLPVQTWPQYELEPRNMLGVCVDCHAAHEHGGVNRRPIRRGEIAWPVVEFVLGEGLAWFLVRTYPLRGA